MPSYAKGLRCKGCGSTYPLEMRTACDECFGMLEVYYDMEALSSEVFRGRVEMRGPTLWRYIEMLPLEGERVDIHPGFTPLKRCRRLGRLLGLDHLYVKDDTLNPTGSFKDRPTSVAVSKAVEWGLSAVGCASTGNLAGSTAALAARAGLPCYVFIPDGLDPAKVLTALVYGAKVVAIAGTYDDVNRIANRIADRRRWGLVNINVRPYYTEGSKTIAFETCEQLSWRIPDRVVVPLGSGALLASVHKAFRELEDLGWVDEHPVRICGSQPEGCSPIADAFVSGAEEISPVEHPDTVAESLAIGDPASGYEALNIIRSSGGWADAPSAEDVVKAQLLLAREEGVFCEPAGGTVIASLKRMVEAGEVDRDESVVCMVTGSGFKSTKGVSGFISDVQKAGNSPDDVERLLG